MKAGDKVTVSVPVDRNALTVINEEGEKISGGNRYAVSVGFGQPDSRTEELTGKKAFSFTVVR